MNYDYKLRLVADNLGIRDILEGFIRSIDPNCRKEENTIYDNTYEFSVPLSDDQVCDLTRRLIEMGKEDIFDTVSWTFEQRPHPE